MPQNRRLQKNLKLFAFTLPFALTGCGGGGGSQSAGEVIYTFNNNQKGVVSFSDKASAESSLALTWGTVLGQSNAAQAQALVAAMASLSQFRSGGVSKDSTAWGIYKDGTELVLATNDPILTKLSPSNFNPALKANDSSVTSPAASRTIPGASLAYVFDSFEPSRPNTSFATPIAQLNTAGFKVISSNGSLSDWESLAGAGFVMAEGPGTLALNSGGVLGFFKGVSDQVNSLTDSQNSGKLQARTLAHLEVIAVDADGSTSYPAVRYAFSSGFLPARSGFSHNSFLLDLSSDSASDPSYISSMTQVLGSSAFAGWNGTVSNSDGQGTGLFFLDRALGLDQAAPIDPTTPPPAAYSSLYSKLGATTRPSLGYSFSQAGTGSVLSFILGGESATTLIPSISAGTVSPDGSSLVLSGSFGSQTGTASFDGTPLSVVSWSPTSVTLTKPLATGKILLTDQGLTSNSYAFSVPSLSMTPTNPSVAKSGSVLFTIKPPTGVTGSVVYDWTQSTNDAILTSADGVVGHSIETASTQVTLSLTSSDTGTLTVTVKAYQLNALGARTLVGQSQAVVAITG